MAKIAVQVLGKSRTVISVAGTTLLCSVYAAESSALRAVDEGVDEGGASPLTSHSHRRQEVTQPEVHGLQRAVFRFGARQAAESLLGNAKSLECWRLNATLSSEFRGLAIA